MAVAERNRQPLYRQVAQEIKGLIERGGWTPDQRLPSEPDLARQFSVSRATVREALRVLDQEGVVRASRGQGTFVQPARRLPNVGIDTLYSITDVIRHQGCVPGTADLRIRISELGMAFPTTPAGPPIALGDEEPVAVIERTRLADGRPVAYTIDAVPLRYLTAPRWDERLGTESLFDLLMEGGLRVEHTQTRLFAVEATPEAATRLELRPGAPVLIALETVYDRNHVPLVVSRDYYRTDRIQVMVVRACR